MTAPAGWYPAPNEPPNTYRWWTGTGWSYAFHVQRQPIVQTNTAVIEKPVRYRTQVKVVGKSRMKTLVKQGWSLQTETRSLLGPPRYTVTRRKVR